MFAQTKPAPTLLPYPAETIKPINGSKYYMFSPPPTSWVTCSPPPPLPSWVTCSHPPFLGSLVPRPSLPTHCTTTLLQCKQWKARLKLLCHQRLFSYIIKTVHYCVLKLAPRSWSTCSFIHDSIWRYQSKMNWPPRKA